MKKGLWLIVAILIATVLILWKVVIQTRSENNRLTANQETLLTKIHYYRTSDSLNAAGVNVLKLKNKEFQQYNAGLLKIINDLNLKLKRLQAVSQTSTETEYQIKTEIRDSIIILPGRVDTLNCLDYRDPYFTFSGCITGKQFSGLIRSRDTIIQIIHRVPRRFWFIRWGTKAIRQEIISRNPNSRITYTEYIELKK